ncbi:hypothetical protein [Streptomyces johnsoniae]|uniref:Uncharacterized protein n=1 Tax=Streptomyces johnsoniae TaxID=3075532 RepID=A0ABU2S090_9ACTN|nr:hypothetical protein [Streptomyces sp. DSM 41886]MDT0442327.1 hypothetical protein [Streptomyces sp. DSM 41886]
MSRLPARIPAPLSGRSGGASETYTPVDASYDIAIGGMPFMLAINPERPMTRGLAQIRKEQFDNQEIPGEQSLADWWLRSQATFIGGAGLLYQDPDVSNQWAIQYGDSVGLNPWVNGRLSLLRRTELDVTAATTQRHHVLGYADGTDRYWSAADTVLTSSDGSSHTVVTWGGTETILSLASDGEDYYAADEVGIYQGTGSGAGTLAWNTGDPDVVVGWAMGRLMAGIGASVYELAGGEPPTLPEPVFTHPAAGWQWTAISEGSSAIYVAGYSGSVSAIYKFTLEVDGSVPVLSGGIQAASLPHGEVVLSMSAYLGTYVGIGTSRGFRVGELSDSGDIVYGPLLVETPVRGMVGYDRFFFIGAEDAINGSSGLYRVDLGQPLESQGPSASLRHAYATDLQAHAAGEVDGVTLLGNSDRVVFTVRGSGSYVEHADELEPTGTFTTGRVRYNTLVEKIFKFLTVRSERPLNGSITAAVIDPTGGENTVITVSGNASIENVLLRSPVTVAEWLQLKLTINRDSVNPELGPVVTGWQFKALPGEIRQRVFMLPLLAFDHEQDRYGQIVGWEGRTLGRLEAFEQIIQRGDVIALQDLRTNTTTQVVVDNDEYEFRQSVPPANCGGWGGYIYIRLRTVTDAIT